MEILFQNNRSKIIFIFASERNINHMPKQLTVLIQPHPILRKISEELAETELNKKEVQEFLDDLTETMFKKDGAGLAAPQVGKNIRAIAILMEKTQEAIVMINPVITKKSWAKEIGEEGCLSVLNEQGEIVYGLVERHKKINCIYYDRQGRKRKLKAANMLARVIQHEIDHLDGILFIDKLAKGGLAPAPKPKRSEGVL